jgi:hypothetical protein
MREGVLYTVNMEPVMSPTLGVSRGDFYAHFGGKPVSDTKLSGRIENINSASKEP